MKNKTKLTIDKLATNNKVCSYSHLEYHCCTRSAKSFVPRLVFAFIALLKVIALNLFASFFVSRCSLVHLSVLLRPRSYCFSNKLKVRRSNNYSYCLSRKSDRESNQRTDTKNKARKKKIKNNYFARSNREKYNDCYRNIGKRINLIAPK